jgi:hypothetical protein
MPNRRQIGIIREAAWSSMIESARRSNSHLPNRATATTASQPVAVHVLQQAWAYILEIENASSVEEA